MKQFYVLLIVAALGLMMPPASGFSAGQRYLFLDISRIGYWGHYGRAIDINDSEGDYQP